MPNKVGCYSFPCFQTGDTLLMPVPSSFNDITQDSELRDFVGWVWYDRQVWVPTSWLDGKKRIMLRFESAHYNTIVVSMFCRWEYCSKRLSMDPQ